MPLGAVHEKQVWVGDSLDSRSSHTARVDGMRLSPAAIVDLSPPIAHSLGAWRGPLPDPRRYFFCSWECETLRNVSKNSPQPPHATMLDKWPMAVNRINIRITKWKNRDARIPTRAIPADSRHGAAGHGLAAEAKSFRNKFGVIRKPQTHCKDLHA